MQTHADSLVFYNSIYKDLSDSQKILKTEILALQNQVIKTDKRIIPFVNNETVFSVTTTISIFILGILIDRIYKWITKLKERKVLRSYFEHNIKELTTSYTSILADQYKRAYFDNDINSGIPLTRPVLLSGVLNRFKEIDSKELYKSYKDLKLLAKVRDKVDVIIMLEEQVDQYHLTSRQTSQEQRKVLADLTDDYIAALVELSEEFKKSDPNYSSNSIYLLVVSSIQKNYAEFAGKRVVTRFYREINRPIQHALVESKLYKELDSAYKVATIGKDWAHKYHGLRVLSVEIRLQYRVFAKIAAKTNDFLKTNINTLK